MSGTGWGWWSGVVRCAVLWWCGVVWCGVVWCGVTWREGCVGGSCSCAGLWVCVIGSVCVLICRCSV